MSSHDELMPHWAKFFGQVDSFHQSSKRYPTEWEPRIELAVQLKRRGEYAEAAQIYFDLIQDSGTMYTGVLAALYKVLASAGLFLQAFLLLQLAQSIYAKDPDPIAQSVGMRSTFEVHSEQLLAAMKSEPALLAYLTGISGNPDYRLPGDYATIARDWSQTTDALVKGFGEKKSGCYIATAVYGSYDAAPVLVLRRFRDEALARSAPGRLFIRFYYAVSPSAARYVAKRPVLKRVSRQVLDMVVLHRSAREESLRDDPGEAAGESLAPTRPRGRIGA